MAKYRLTNAADADIERLFVFGFTTFGLEQADTYVTGLYEQLDNSGLDLAIQVESSLSSQE